MTQPYQLAPAQLQKYFDNNGRPLNGGLVYTYAAGTTSPQASYPSSSSGTPNPNPVVLNSRGEGAIWLDPSLAYKINVTDSNGNQIPGWPQDNIPGGIFSQQIIGNIIYPITAAEISTSITPTFYIYPPGDVRRYGATGNGTTDDSGAIQNALNVAAVTNNRQPVLLAGGANYRCASGITIPPTVYMYGQGNSPDSNVGWGTRLTFDLGVATCVTMGQSGGSPACGLSGVNIWRAAGTIPASSIGLLVLDGNQSSIYHVAIMRHAIGLKVLADGVGGGGLGLTIDDLHLGIASDAYYVQDTWAEVRITNSRFGTNGNDITANTYLRFQGGSASNAGAGPNTFYATNCHFEANPTFPTHWIEFVNQTPAAISSIADFHFVNCHIEGILASTGAFIFSDSTWPTIKGLAITNCSFSPDVGGTTFLALNSATTATSWLISNNNIAVGITLAPASTFLEVLLSNNDIGGNVSITGVSGAEYSSVGNIIRGNLTLAGNYSRLRSDDQLTGTFTFSATGTFSEAIDLTGSSYAKGTWTPVVTFGGGSTGQTYSRQAGTYQIIGNMICGSYDVIFTAIGSSTGAALLTGLPYPSANQVSAPGGGGPVSYTSGMASLTSSVTATVNQNASTMPLWETGATGATQLTNANFSSTSNIAGVFCYQWQ